MGTFGFIYHMPDAADAQCATRGNLPSVQRVNNPSIDNTSELHPLPRYAVSQGLAVSSHGKYSTGLYCRRHCLAEAMPVG